MNRFLTLLGVFVCLALLSGPASLGGDPKKDPKKEASVWMKAKMGYSQQILFGLTEGNFDKIKTNAIALNVVGFLEAWERANQPNYRQQVLLFAAANKELIRQAEAKNLYGAALAYNQLAVSCVQCHHIVRDAKK